MQNETIRTQNIENRNQKINIRKQKDNKQKLEYRKQNEQAEWNQQKVVNRMLIAKIRKQQANSKQKVESRKWKAENSKLIAPKSGQNSGSRVKKQNKTSRN